MYKLHVKLTQKCMRHAMTGLENSTRPLVFTSATGCRASENFDSSCENYIFSHRCQYNCDAGQVLILRYFEVCMIPKYILTPNLGFLPQIIYRYALSSTFLEQKPEVKVTVTWKHLVTLQRPRHIYIPNMKCYHK